MNNKHRKVNRSKTIRVIAGVLALVGFIMMLGIAGTADKADRMGECMLIKDSQFIVGILMMLPALFVFKDEPEERENKHGKKSK